MTALPGTEKPAEKAAGHWLLAQLGKKVLRPGGVETTRWLLAQTVTSRADVVEFAPGMGITAQEILSRNPRSYCGVDADEKAAAIVRSKLPDGDYRVLHASAEATTLPAESADVVVGEAMLTMQTEQHKLDIMQEAARILRPGGFYAIHELCLTPDYLHEDVKTEVQRDLARSIRVNARPITVSEWAALAERAGFEVLDTYRASMALLEPQRMIADEGLGMVKILFNLARKPQIRQRVLGMRSTFARHSDHLGAVGLVLRKK